MKFVSRLVKQSRRETKTVIMKCVSRLVKQSRRETKASNREICIMAGKTEAGETTQRAERENIY